MRSELGVVCSAVLVAGTAMADLVSPPVVDAFTGTGWNLGSSAQTSAPPLSTETCDRDHGYTGVAWQRTVTASQALYLNDGIQIGDPEVTEGEGAASTALDPISRTMTVTTSGAGAVLLNYSDPGSPLNLNDWNGLWMRYTVSTGKARVSVWLGNDEFQSFAAATLPEGGASSGYLYFAFYAHPNMTTLFQSSGTPDYSAVTGITLQFRSEDGNPLAMTVTGGIIPAPGAVALFALPTLLVRRRKV
ncbi:MAG: hypothetical protein EBR71_11705 [Planctomycetes bacterium]|nr:hypothetical protein [Planctomycetota bacterium]